MTQLERPDPPTHGVALASYLQGPLDTEKMLGEDCQSISLAMLPAAFPRSCRILTTSAAELVLIL